MNKNYTCKKEKHVWRFSSFHGSIMLTGNDNHSTRKLLTDSMLKEVTVSSGQRTHNNGNLWFTLFDRLFYVSSMLNGNALFILSHFKSLVTSCCLSGTSNTPHKLQRLKSQAWKSGIIQYCISVQNKRTLEIYTQILYY